MSRQPVFDLPIGCAALTYDGRGACTRNAVASVLYSPRSGAECAEIAMCRQHALRAERVGEMGDEDEMYDYDLTSWWGGTRTPPA